MTSAITTSSRVSESSITQQAWTRLPATYAIPASAPSLAEARQYCAHLARSHYENFSVASWFLPKHLRQDFFNVYAYCRISDDLGDEVGDAAMSLALLDQWQSELDACYNGAPRHPVFIVAAIMIPSASNFPTTPAPLCNSRTSGRIFPSTTPKAVFISRSKIYAAFR